MKRNDPPLAGVIFCGGCNPQYDRALFYEEIKKHFHGRMQFQLFRENAFYDIVLVMNGCSSECLIAERQFPAPLAVLNSDDLSLAAARISSALQQIISPTPCGL